MTIKIIDSQLLLQHKEIYYIIVIFAKKLTNYKKPAKKVVLMPIYGWYELVSCNFTANARI